MTRLRVAVRRLGGLVGRDRHDAELREELESLAALQYDDQVSAGVPPEEARRRVLARTGSVTAAGSRVKSGST